MKSKTQPEEISLLVKPATVQLNTQETRDILTVAACNGRPCASVATYQARALIEMGIMREVPCGKQQNEAKETEAWNKARQAVFAHDVSALTSAQHTLSNLRQEGQKRGLVLTDRGKKLAQGLSIRITTSARR